MFNPTLIVIEAFIRELRAMYERTYTILEPNYPGILSFAAQLALETIATSDVLWVSTAALLAGLLLLYAPTATRGVCGLCGALRTSWWRLRSPDWRPN